MRAGWLALGVLTVTGIASGQSRRAVFEGAGKEVTWPLKDFDAALPADWSGFQYLVMELRLSSPQRFDLRIHDAGGVRSVKLAPVPGAWIRSAGPPKFITKAPRRGHRLGFRHQKTRAVMFFYFCGTPGPPAAP